MSLSKCSVRRLLAGAATAVVCMALVAEPASAVGLDIASGSILVEDATGGNDVPFPLGPSDGPCDDPTIDVSFANGIVTVNTLNASGSFAFSGQRLVEMSLDSIAGATQQGTYSGSSPASIDNVDVGIQASLYDDANEDCEPDDEAICSFVFNVALDGEFSGSPAAPTTGDTFDVDLVTTFPFTPLDACPAPFSTYIDGTASGSIIAEV